VRSTSRLTAVRNEGAVAVRSTSRLTAVRDILSAGASKGWFLLVVIGETQAWSNYGTTGCLLNMLRASRPGEVKRREDVDVADRSRSPAYWVPTCRTFAAGRSLVSCRRNRTADHRAGHQTCTEPQTWSYAARVHPCGSLSPLKGSGVGGPRQLQSTSSSPSHMTQAVSASCFQASGLTQWPSGVLFAHTLTGYPHLFAVPSARRRPPLVRSLGPHSGEATYSAAVQFLRVINLRLRATVRRV
jgi:hypothetical protein